MKTGRKSETVAPVVKNTDPCRLARQVKQFGSSRQPRELLHLPDEPAGVDEALGPHR